MKTLKRFVLAVLGVLLFPSLVFAQTVVVDPFDPAVLIRTLQTGAQAGAWGPVAIAALMLSVVAVRWLAGKFPDSKAFSWVRTTAGGWGLNLGGSALAALAALFGSGGPITVVTVLGAIVSAVITGFAAAGALEAKKDLLGGAKAAGLTAVGSIGSKTDALEELK